MRPAPGAYVQLERVDKVFPDGLETLSGFSLDVAPGAFTALIGPSGCGKTTALRIAAGLDAPTSGRVAVRGPQGPARIGYVFQAPTLTPWASALDNVALPMRLKNVPARAARERASAALERVGLEAFAHARPAELSGGMAMRVSIARALADGPDLLLMDEPFAALDEMTRFALGEDLLALRAEAGFTVLFVTHSVFEAASLADRIAVMTPRPGRVAATVENPAPAPRDAAYRSSEAFLLMVRLVGTALAEASTVLGA